MKIVKYFLIMLIILMVAGGCSSTNNKPTQPAPSSPAPSNSESSSPSPNTSISFKSPSANPSSPMKVAGQAATEADKVVGVNTATAFVADRVIYIGLDLNANTDKNNLLAIENSVINRVKQTESGYTVRVTSDPDTVALINTVSQGIEQGKSISDFKYEVNKITINLTPKGD